MEHLDGDTLAFLCIGAPSGLLLIMLPTISEWLRKRNERTKQRGKR